MTQRASESGAWVLVGTEYTLGGEYDKAIVVALRRLDPAIAPLWVVKAYRTPSGRIEKCPRQVIARYVPNPVVQSMDKIDFDRIAIRGVAMPSVVPKELEGLPSSGPYLEAELLEGPSEDDGLTPGPPLPMTWELVRRFEASQHALRTHTISELDAKRISRGLDREARRERDMREDLRALGRHAREQRLLRSGEMVRLSSGNGMDVSISEGLMRLRKIAAEGAQA